MPTIIDYATEMAFKFLAECERTYPAFSDEDRYNGFLGSIWDTLVRDLNAYVYYGNGYTDGEAQEPQERVLRRLLEARPVQQAAVQTFLEHFVPDWERLVRNALPTCEAKWHEVFLSIAADLSQEAEGAYIPKTPRGKEAKRGAVNQVYRGGGYRTCTCDLRVMGPPSCFCSKPLPLL